MKKNKMSHCSHLHEDSVLLEIIICHFPAVSAPVGDHLCLAEGHLVHLLDMSVEVAGGAAGVLTDWAQPGFGSTGKNGFQLKNVVLKLQNSESVK